MEYLPDITLAIIDWSWPINDFRPGIESSLPLLEKYRFGDVVYISTGCTCLVPDEYRWTGMRAVKSYAFSQEQAFEMVVKRTIAPIIRTRYLLAVSNDASIPPDPVFDESITGFDTIYSGMFPVFADMSKKHASRDHGRGIEFLAKLCVIPVCE